MAIVPVRLSPVFLVREQVTVPFPLPEDGLTFVIHAAAEEATAVHVQEAPAVTPTVPVGASPSASAEDGGGEDVVIFVMGGEGEEAAAVHVQEAPAVTPTVPVGASPSASAEDGERE